METIGQPDLIKVESSFNYQPISKRKLATYASLGLGFDPTAIEPESGFKPIVQGQGSSIPSLAFSVLDGADRPPISTQLYESKPMSPMQKPGYQQVAQIMPQYEEYDYESYEVSFE